MIAIGLMSGTSLDGIDAALLNIRPAGKTYEIALLEFATTPYSEALLAQFASMLPPHSGSAAAMAAVHQAVGQAYADAAAAIAQGRSVDYIAMHGQTIYHDGARAQTLQVGSPYYARDRLAASVCFDFRSADCALGGHGAPLVPYVDSLLLTSPEKDRVAINIGGIANLTYLPRAGVPSEAVAFDCGPGNMLIDAFVSARSNGVQRFDERGTLAAQGVVNDAALQGMQEDPYFRQAPPKSSGREQFGSHFLHAYGALLAALSPQDVAATLTALTATTIADALISIAPVGAEVLVSGGGTENDTLMRMLKERLSGYCVETTDTMHLRSAAKEALAFAVFGYETLRMRPANLPRVTGATQATVLGAVAPYQLDRLFERVKAECAE